MNQALTSPEVLCVCRNLDETYNRIDSGRALAKHLHEMGIDNNVLSSIIAADVAMFGADLRCLRGLVGDEALAGILLNPATPLAQGGGLAALIDTVAEAAPELVDVLLAAATTVVCDLFAEMLLACGGGFPGDAVAESETDYMPNFVLVGEPHEVPADEPARNSAYQRLRDWLGL